MAQYLLQAQKPEIGIMQALESLNDTQVMLSSFYHKHDLGRVIQV